jgi:cytochrome c553
MRQCNLSTIAIFGRGTSRAALLAACVLACLAAPPVAADTARLSAYGKHLSGECTSCHRIDGVDNGIPSITGWDPEEFVATMIFYRNGERPNQAMVSVAQSLDDQQMQALAHYFGSLPKPARQR